MMKRNVEKNISQPLLQFKVGGIKAFYLPVNTAEYKVVISGGVKRFKLKVRDGTALKIGLEPGEVLNSAPDARYWTLAANAVLEWNDIPPVKDIGGYGGLILYVNCGADAKTVEVWEWE